MTLKIEEGDFCCLAYPQGCSGEWEKHTREENVKVWDGVKTL